MKTITVNLDDAKALRLRERAEQLGLREDQLVHASIDDLLSYPDPTFNDAAERVIKKNDKLYRRLG